MNVLMTGPSMPASDFGGVHIRENVGENLPETKIHANAKAMCCQLKLPVCGSKCLCNA